MSFEELLFSNVKSIMSPNVLTAKEQESVKDVIRKMVDKRVGAIVIVNDQEKVTGIFTERDLLKQMALKDLDPNIVTISEVMTHKPFTANSNTTISEAFNVLQVGSFRHMPVLDDDELVGIISIKDINRFIHKLVFIQMSGKLEDKEEDAAGNK